jgi:hypothetical protein
VKRFKCAIEKQVCFGGGARPRRPRVWKTKPTRGTDAKSKKLVELIVSFSNVKEDVYGGLDAWCAWELEFPLVAVKKALRLLQGEQQWRRIIQVSHSFVWCEDIDLFGETQNCFIAVFVCISTINLYENI